MRSPIEQYIRRAVVLLYQACQVNGCQLAFFYDELPTDHGAIGLGGRAKYHRRYGIVKSAGVTEPVESNGEEIGAFAWLQ